MKNARGQSLVEFALVVPILLLLFAAAADFGRAFYAYVAIENASKEGALYGSRAPLCDDDSLGGACDNPNNVVWRVQNELKEQGVRMPDGSNLVPAIECQTTSGVTQALSACAPGDIYQVQVAYPFKLLTPILGSIIGDLDLRATSRAVALNLAFDPNPGASINKFVSPVGAVNADDITSKCLEPDDLSAGGLYRSPCRDSSTAEPNDFLTLRFEETVAIQYRIIVSNTGGQALSGVTVSDTKGSTGCAFSPTIGVGVTLPPCDYTRTAPIVPGAAITMNYDNSAIVDTGQTEPARSDIRVAVEKPPPRLRVLKWISSFQDGDDGDGQPGFGTVDDLTATYRTAPQVSQGSVWFKLIVRNTGGQTATGLAVTDSHGNLPVTATCPAVPSTLGAGASWQCVYSVPFNSASPAATQNAVTATAGNVVPDSNDSATATLRVESCAGTNNRTIPNLIGLKRGDAQTAWTTAGFTGTLSDWGNGNQDVVTQSRPAYGCVPATSTMTITKSVTA